MRYYCGFEFAPLDDWQSYVGEVRAPSNYKDGAKIAAYINKRLAELEETAARHALAGTISRAVVVRDGKTAFDEKDQFVGTKFLEYIHKDSDWEVDTSRKDNIVIVGCYMHSAARMAAIDYMKVNGSLPFGLQWALEMDPDFRYNRVPGFMDPISVIAGSSTHGATAVAKAFGLPVNENDAESLAVLAAQLGNRLWP